MKLREDIQQSTFLAVVLLALMHVPKNRTSLEGGFLLVLAGFLVRGIANSQILVSKEVKGKTNTSHGIYRNLAHPDFLGWTLLLSGIAIASESFDAAVLTATTISTFLLLRLSIPGVNTARFKNILWAKEGLAVSKMDWLPNIVPQSSDALTPSIRLSFSRGFWKGKRGEVRRSLSILIAFVTLWIYQWNPGVYWIRTIGMLGNIALGIVMLMHAIRLEKRSLPFKQWYRTARK